MVDNAAACNYAGTCLCSIDYEVRPTIYTVQSHTANVLKRGDTPLGSVATRLAKALGIYHIWDPERTAAPTVADTNAFTPAL